MFQCSALNGVRSGLQMLVRPLSSVGQMALDEPDSGRRVHFVIEDSGTLQYLTSSFGEEIDRGIVADHREFEMLVDWVRCSLSKSN
jgi:hypothetical protein